jgi:hypothetical protein
MEPRSKSVKNSSKERDESLLTSASSRGRGSLRREFVSVLSIGGTLLLPFVEKSPVNHS